MTTHVSIIAMRTIFVALVVDTHVFPEGLLALLACEYHLCCSLERVVRDFCMTFWALRVRVEHQSALDSA